MWLGCPCEVDRFALLEVVECCLEREQLAREFGAAKGFQQFFGMVGEIGQPGIVRLGGTIGEVVASAAAEFPLGRRQV